MCLAEFVFRCQVKSYFKLYLYRKRNFPDDAELILCGQGVSRIKFSKIKVAGRGSSLRDVLCAVRLRHAGESGSPRRLVMSCLPERLLSEGLVDFVTPLGISVMGEASRQFSPSYSWRSSQLPR